MKQKDILDTNCMDEHRKTMKVKKGRLFLTVNVFFVFLYLLFAFVFPSTYLCLCFAKLFLDYRNTITTRSGLVVVAGLTVARLKWSS